jgi:hypothetical protein
MIGVWIGNATTDWLAFCEDVNNFGVLTWDITDQELSTSVDFMDLTLSIVGSKIVSKTYQKKMNLYLYIPPSSAHPAGCLKGTVYGLIRRYYAQNTFRHDFVRLVLLLYRRLIDRSWKREAIRSLWKPAVLSNEKLNLQQLCRLNLQATVWMTRTRIDSSFTSSIIQTIFHANESSNSIKSIAGKYSSAS